MPESILELAAADVADSLESITTGAGYSVNADVVRESKEGDSPADNRFVVRVGDPAPKPNAPYGFDEYLVPVEVTAYHLPLNEDETPVATILARRAADVRKSLMVDPHRGGYAVHTQFTTRDEFNTQAPPFFVKVVAYLWVRTRLGNPYAQS